MKYILMGITLSLIGACSSDAELPLENVVTEEVPPQSQELCADPREIYDEMNLNNKVTLLYLEGIYAEEFVDYFNESTQSHFNVDTVIVVGETILEYDHPEKTMGLRFFKDKCEKLNQTFDFMDIIELLVETSKRTEIKQSFLFTSSENTVL